MIWACGNEKAPRPDGYTFKFIKRYWDILKEDIVNVVKHFERFGVISRGCNASFLTLVPKIKYPLKIGDYRPISLIGSLYKIIVKSLSIRLTKIIGVCIGEVQSAFVAGRNILNGPLVISEMCSWAKKVNKKLIRYKVDFNKAFDTVNWEYMDLVQMQMGFGQWLWGCIQGCLRSSRAPVLVNDSPTNEFEIGRGIRQGDPLSPFLFIIAMEGLNIAMKGT